MNLGGAEFCLLCSGLIGVLKTKLEPEMATSTGAKAGPFPNRAGTFCHEHLRDHRDTFCDSTLDAYLGETAVLGEFS